MTDHPQGKQLAGLVIRVKDWPGTYGERYVVEKVVDVPGSEWPLQVYAQAVQPDGRVCGFRAFPIGLCTVDRQATARHEARTARRKGQQ